MPEVFTEYLGEKLIAADVPIIRTEKGLWRQTGITPTGEWYIQATDAATSTAM